MLGIVNIAQATGEYLPDLQKIQAPLEGPDSVAYQFCTGCGNTLELTQTGVEQIIALIGSLPDDLSSIFFQVSSCSCCDGKEKTISVVKK